MADPKKHLFWLSFSGESGALGVALVWSSTANGDDAVRVAETLGIHPGGDNVIAYEVPEEHHEPLLEHVGKFARPEDVHLFGGLPVTTITNGEDSSLEVELGHV